MTMRTTKTTVTFTQPFSLSGFDGKQPAGSYSVETDEELLDGVSFPAYRRMATMMQLQSGASLKNNASGILQVAVIDPAQLAAALAADAVQNEGVADIGADIDADIDGRAMRGIWTAPGNADQER